MNTAFRIIGMMVALCLVIVGFIKMGDAGSDLGKSLNEQRIERITSTPGYQAPGIMKIGEKWEVDYIQHNKDNEYQIGVIKKGTLKWYTLGTDTRTELEKHVLNVKLDKTITKPYLIREKDDEITAVYELRIPEKESIQAGVYKEIYMTQGSHSYYRDVQTTMIYPN